MPAFDDNASESAGPKPPGLIIAGPQPGCGKTVVMALLLAALREKKIPIQPFTVGPWFIDPAYHTEAAGVPCCCLDMWLMGAEGVRAKLRDRGAGRLSFIEAQGGLFDGADLGDGAQRLAELRQLVPWPVVLVVPANRATKSLISSIKLLQEEMGSDVLGGIILNQVTNVAQQAYFTDALAALGVPILGQVQAIAPLYWPRRYLGLTPRVELPDLDMARLGPLGRQMINLNAVTALAQPASPGPKPLTLPPPSARIGVAQDEAFHFYYPFNLDFLEQHGVELVPFSPLRDRHLPPDLHGLLLGSGFPELFATKLAANSLLRLEVAHALRGGLPCYAEGGGMMWLAEAIITLDGQTHPMVGVIPGVIEMTNQDQSVGYCVAHGYGVDSEKTFRGHEFHYSRWREATAYANLWSVRNLRTGTTKMEGYHAPNLHASYVNLYFPTAPEVILRALHLECPEPVRVTAAYKRKTGSLPPPHLKPPTGPLPPAPTHSTPAGVAPVSPLARPASSPKPGAPSWPPRKAS